MRTSVRTHAPRIDPELRNRPERSNHSYGPYFLRSAQRFFMANESRLLPSGVRPPPFFAFNVGGRGVGTLVFLAVRCKFALSTTAMARLILSLSCFKSATILSSRVLRKGLNHEFGLVG
jgi:hypothetical protein